MEKRQALHFRDAFRDGRSRALRDAESFECLLFALEQLARRIGGRRGLGANRELVRQFAGASPLAERIPASWRGLHTPFGVLYAQFTRARNAALHEGAFARHLVSDAVKIAIVMEDVLTMDLEEVGDYMVRSPLEASMWQPISFIRQSLLANSFSFMPVDSGVSGARWKLVSDHALAKLLRGSSQAERERRLLLPLEVAVAEKLMTLVDPFTCLPETRVSEALRSSSGTPILVVDSSEQLLGIATPFDFL